MTLFKYLSVAVAAISPVLGASPTIVTRDASSLNPSGIELQPVDPPNGIAERAPLPQSNAERMKRGLGPNKPRFAHESTCNLLNCDHQADMSSREEYPGPTITCTLHAS